MNETPIDMVLYCQKCGMQHLDAPDPGVPAVGIRRTENGGVPFDYLAEPTWGNPPHKSHLCHGCGHIWRPSDHPTNGVARTASGKHADTAPADLATLRAENERLRKDAERYLWLREQYEHTRLPLAAVVWKQNNDRQSSEWVNLVNGDALDAAIDAAIAREEKSFNNQGDSNG